MKFQSLVAVLATTAFTVQVNAQSDGLLRRFAQNDTQVTTVTTEVNTTTTAPQAVQAAPSAAQQPATVVEAAPAVESKAEQLRKARQSAEISTEQKIVEKLEESRLREEQERADRLFGTKLDASAQQQLQEAMSAPAQKVEPAPIEKPAVQATQVTIEKVEIVQPAPALLPPPEIKSVEEVKEEAPAPAAAAPKAASSLSVQAEEIEAEEEKESQKFYVNAALGAVSYDASNVKGNFGGGVAVGLLVNERTAMELGFLYSNHFIDTFWEPSIYREMDQYDISLTGKYNFLTGRIRPYVGAGAAYIIRNYQQRIWTQNLNGQIVSVAGPSEDQTDSINFLLMAGADFQVSENISIGAGVDYSTNVMNRSEFNFQNYQLPEGTKALEEIDFFTTKVTAKMTF